MNTPDDHFREFFRAVTPAKFSPCPVPVSTVPSSFTLRDARRNAWLSRAALAIAASVLAVVALMMAPTKRMSAPNGDPTMLNDATADGKALKERVKNK